MIIHCAQGWKWYERIVERIISEELSILCLIWPPKRMSRCKRFSIKIDCIRHVIYVCTEENIDGMILPTTKVGRRINWVWYQEKIVVCKRICMIWIVRLSLFQILYQMCTKCIRSMYFYIPWNWTFCSINSMLCPYFTNVIINLLYSES